MKGLKLISAAVLVVLALGVLAACGAPPVAMADIPVLSQAAPLEKGKNPVADAASDALDKALTGQSLKSEVKLYSVPADVTWDQVKSFYTEKLGSGDWKSSDQLTHESDAFSTLGWTRSGESQALVVGYGPDILGNGTPFVMVMLASK
ncbi:MAG: hypothetical protein ACJ8CR_18080 [Roseiflexaceae bacterium]